MSNARIMQNLPSYYEGIREFSELASTESMELDMLEAAIGQLFADRVVMTASVAAVKRREQMLGIRAEPSETLSFRRRRILNRYQTKPPFTVRYMQQLLDRLVGPGLTIVSVDVQEFILYVTANIDDAEVFREVQHTIQTIKPANMVYQQNTALSAAIGLEERISKQDITWHYKLDGSWLLGETAFATFEPEEVIK